MPHSIQKYIAALLIFILITSSVSGYSDEAVHSIEELSGYSDIAGDLIAEQEEYRETHHASVSVFDTESDLIGPSYVIEETSRVSGEVASRRVTSELLESTLVRNMTRDSGMTPQITITEAGPDADIHAEQSFARDGLTPQTLLTFEFGTPGEHLVFSTPVALSVDTPDIPDGEFVDLRVHHAGDSEYNTSGLMIDGDGVCLPDGTASRPASRVQVSGSRVSFYTCGASTFALGYVPSRDYPNSTVWSLAPQTDGKVILGGAFTTVGGIAMGRVARVSTGGSIDPTFTNPNANNIVYATAVQADGKILIGGTFTLIGATTRNYIARLNTDGTLDATFNPNIAVVAGNQVRAITVQPDGKILIGGTFATVGGVARNRIARLNTDGTLDLTFNPNSNNNVYAITLQPDNKILVGGAFTTIAGTARNRAARLLTTGAIDATWNPNANNIVWDIKLFTTGDIILAGQFTTVGGVARNRIAKVSTLGVLDAAWNPNANNNVLALSIDSSNNVIFGGTFTTIGVTARNRIARVSATGVLDLTLDPNANNTVCALGRDTDTNLLVGGLFTTMSNKATAYFSWVGLNTDIVPPQILSISLASGALLPIGNFTVTTNYTDTGAGINTASVAITLERWNGVSWGVNVAPTYLSASGATTTIATHTLTGVPYGKYRFRISVADIVGNVSAVSERTFFIDQLNWTVSQDTVDVGDLMPGIQRNSAPSEFTITIQTVGAPFTLTLSGTTMIGQTMTIGHWTGALGYGYELYNTGYTNILSSLTSPATLATQGANIHPDGNKRTYTYRIQYGARIDEMTPAGNYQALAGLQIVASY